MTSSNVRDFDVVVVGGGPSGSTVSTLVAQQGHRVLLLEKERFPRYQIGESLLPSTVHGVCRMLGVSEELHKAGFTRKRGGTFKWGTGKDPWTFRFAVSPKMATGSYAYQVERIRFDQILLDNARRTGVEVLERSSVVDVVADADRVRGLRYTDADGNEHEVRARYVVDASGNKSRIHRHTGGTRHYSEFFRNLALFGYFKGGKRLPAPNSGNILSVAFDGGWFWYIPLTEELTSVGAVVDRRRAAEIQGNPEVALRGFIDDCPLIREYLTAAERVTDGPYGELRVRKDYSYCQTKFWRPGLVLVGDAACFVDPVFSSGVHLATYSGLLAARSINSALAGTVGEEPAFAEFEQRYRREYGLFYEFLIAFYDMHSAEESYFWEAKKVTRCPASELEAFVELVGGVASGESSLLDPESLTARFSASAKEFATKVDESGGQVFGSKVVDNAMREGTLLLVPSETGTQWRVEP